MSEKENKNHQVNRKLQREARALAKEKGIKYTTALRELLASHIKE